MRDEILLFLLQFVAESRPERGPGQAPPENWQLYERAATLRTKLLAESGDDLA